MHVNSWFQKPHGTKNLACHDKYWCHKFKTQKFYGVTKNYGLP